MKLTRERLTKLIRAASKTRQDEIGCGECFDKLHEFAELELQGKSPQEALPLVEDHLRKCGDCRQEYEALLLAMRHLKATG